MKTISSRHILLFTSLVLMSISGNNFFIQICSITSVYLIILNNLRLKYNAGLAAVTIGFVVIFMIVFFLYHYPTNAFRLLQVMFYFYITSFVAIELIDLDPSYQRRILKILLFLFYFSSVLQFSNILGPSLNYYHELVGNELPTNITRESSLGLLGLRMHGLFSEPSYFGAFMGIFLFGKYRIDKNFMFLLVGALAAFVLCPTPNIFASIIPMFAIRAITANRFGTIQFVVYVIILASGSIYWFREHLAAYINMFMLLQYTNTSISLRILNPIITLINFINSDNYFWNVSCADIDGTRCHESAFKFPFISMIIFFSPFFTVFYLWVAAKYFFTNILVTSFIFLVSSALSGGGIFSIQFYIIFSLIHVFVSKKGKVNG